MKIIHLCMLVIVAIALGLTWWAVDKRENLLKEQMKKPVPGIGAGAVSSAKPLQGDGTVIVSPMGSTALPYQAPLKLDSKDWAVTGVHTEMNHDLLATPAELKELRRVAAKLRLHFVISCDSTNEEFWGFAWREGAPPVYQVDYIEDGGKPGWYTGDFPTQSETVNALTQLMQQEPNDLPTHRPAAKPTHPHQCPPRITGFLLTLKGEQNA